MRDWGFMDFEKNLVVARKNKGQVELAIAELTDSDQQPKESQNPELEKYSAEMNKLKWSLESREVMMQLFNMGFTDFSKNYASAQKHKFDLNAVINEIGV